MGLPRYRPPQELSLLERSCGVGHGLSATLSSFPAVLSSYEFPRQLPPSRTAACSTTPPSGGVRPPPRPQQGTFCCLEEGEPTSASVAGPPASTAMIASTNAITATSTTSTTTTPSMSNTDGRCFAVPAKLLTTLLRSQPLLRFSYKRSGIDDSLSNTHAASLYVQGICI